MTKNEGKLNELRVLVVAGESSSDMHAAGVVRKIISSQHLNHLSVQVFGMGGVNLKAAGAEVIVDSREVASVMGLTEVLSSIPKLIRAYRKLINEAKRRKPQVAVLVDFPDFNFIIGKALKRLGIKVVYFVCPQVWAWRTGRVRQMKKFVDCAAVIFPFEEEFYFRRGIKATFVGHPFVDEFIDWQQQSIALHSADDKAGLKALSTELGLDPVRPIIALLPGSRRAEVSKLLGPMVEGYKHIALTRPGFQAVIPVADTLDIQWIKEQLPSDCNITLLHGSARKLLQIAHCAVVASGTATVETALSGVPFFAVYKMSPITMFVARALVRGVRFFAMPNLIVGKKIIEEFLQEQVTPANIARELERIVGDPNFYSRLKRNLYAVRQALSINSKKQALKSLEASGNQTAYSRVADLVLAHSGIIESEEQKPVHYRRIVGK